MNDKTILIADDDLKLVQALTVRLESVGFKIITTQDAYQALALARQEEPDLLLLDVNMPAGSGFSVQQRIADADDLRTIPTIYITGEDPDNVDRTARELGAFAIIHKPFETDTLLDTIRAALGYWVNDSTCAKSA